MAAAAGLSVGGGEDGSSSSPNTMEAYASCKTAVLSGSCPVSLSEALSLGAMQLRIKMGVYNSKVHKLGFIDDLKTVLPEEHVRTKGSEKKLYAEYKKTSSVDDNPMEMQREYVARVRALPTFGGKFFNVQMKASKKKSKTVPRIFGLLASTVVILDPSSKAVLETYDLDNLRRWAGAPMTFTMDFGDTAGQFLSLQTEEAGVISQAVADVIDTFKKQAQDMTQCAAVLKAAELVKASAENSAAMVKAAKALAIVLKTFIARLQKRAEEVPAKRTRYTECAQALNGGTGKMVEAAKSSDWAGLQNAAAALSLWAAKAKLEISAVLPA